MPAAHRPPRLQPVAQKTLPKLRSLPTPLRLEHPEHAPAVTLVLGEHPSSALSDHSEAESTLPPKPRSLRNQKKLSLNLSAASSNASSTSLILPDSPASIAPPVNIPSSVVASRRRPSVVSLPTATSTLAHRRDGEGSSSVPYVDGPIQVLPGIWIGSEDNARDWKDLVQRGIKSILNVAKEVASPYTLATHASTKSTAPNAHLSTESVDSNADSTFVPSHGGRPAMHYLRLPWSHGQTDLVRGGFVDGMVFVDKSLERGDGVLIHCQCGVSRSATMVIALVMRAAQSTSSSMPAEVLALKSGGMHASYAYVKEKSKWVGPNMSLMYQLLEYERFLSGGNRSPTPSDRSSLLASEEAEWGRRRQELDEASPDEDELESVEFMREARALDLEMEQRIVARKGSQHSTTASISSTGSGIGMGTAWKSRFGHNGRSRAGSVASNFTNRSVLSEDLLEADEDNMDTLLDIPAETSSGTPSTEATEEEARASSRPRYFTPTTARAPPTAPAIKQSFEFLPPPSARHTKTTFGSLLPPPSAPATKQSFNLSAPPSKFKRRRPPPLLPPVPPSPPVCAKSTEPELKPKPKLSQQVPTPLLIPSATSRRSSASSGVAPAPTPSQTLFVFPPEQSVTTPSTMTLTSNFSSVPFPTLSTPRVSTFKKEGRRRSLIVMGAPPTPTTACSRVDALGFVAMGS